MGINASTNIFEHISCFAHTAAGGHRKPVEAKILAAASAAAQADIFAERICSPTFRAGGQRPRRPVGISDV